MFYLLFKKRFTVFNPVPQKFFSIKKNGFKHVREKNVQKPTNILYWKKDKRNWFVNLVSLKVSTFLID